MEVDQDREPDFDVLYRTAEPQEGLFSTAQAQQAGYSLQLLNHHVHAGRFQRVRRGIYRLVHFPPAEHTEILVAWLWSERVGVVSHETALSIYQLSDVLPSRVHLTLPASQRTRRLRVPPGVALHFSDVPAEQRRWLAAAQMTTPARTLNDCALDAMSPELLTAGAREAIKRGLAKRHELFEVEKALQPYGGIE